MTRTPAPTGIDLGADGAVWVTDNEADNVTRVDPTGLVNAIAVGHGPSGIAVGDGGVWVAYTGDDEVVRIDPSTRAVTATIPVGRAPAGRRARRRLGVGRQQRRRNRDAHRSQDR